jgi:hypothetical protein
MLEMADTDALQTPFRRLSTHTPHTPRLVDGGRRPARKAGRHRRPTNEPAAKTTGSNAFEVF